MLPTKGSEKGVSDAPAQLSTSKAQEETITPRIVIIRKETKPMPLSMSTQCQSMTQGSHPPNKPRYTQAMSPHTQNVLGG